MDRSIRQASDGHGSPCWPLDVQGKWARFEWSEGKDFLLNSGQAPGSVEDRMNKIRLVPSRDAASVKSGGERGRMKQLCTSPALCLGHEEKGCRLAHWAASRREASRIFPPVSDDPIMRRPMHQNDANPLLMPGRVKACGERLWKIEGKSKENPTWLLQACPPILAPSCRHPAPLFSLAQGCCTSFSVERSGQSQIVEVARSLQLAPHYAPPYTLPNST